MPRSRRTRAAKPVQPRVKIWMERGGEYLFGYGIAEILRAIDQTGSIKEAAGFRRRGAVVIYVGIDDTDTLDSPGTNQLAQALVVRVAGSHRCRFILRHQLLFDPRVPYTSKNGSASIWLDPLPDSCVGVGDLIAILRDEMRSRFVPGSDPGLCVTEVVPDEVTQFGHRCQRDVVEQRDARSLASRCGIHLEGLGETAGGVIGALAAVGLAATADDGRIVVHGAWLDDLSGPQPIEVLHARSVEVREAASGTTIDRGVIDIGKKLRPNLRGGHIILFVQRAEAIIGSTVDWMALKLT